MTKGERSKNLKTGNRKGKAVSEIKKESANQRYREYISIYKQIKPLEHLSKRGLAIGK